MKADGFTLIEVMVAAALVVLLLTLGAPTFENTVRNSRLTTLANDLLANLNLARSEAIKRGEMVVLCKSSDGARCIGPNWSAGWIVFVNSNGELPPVVDPGEPILRHYAALPLGYTLATNHNFVNFVAYRPSGRSNNMGRFVFCKDNRLENHSRAIFISITGRARIGRDENRNGIPDERDNNEQIIDILGCHP